ncbi:alpha/beta fold hydrolase [Haloferula sp.]|uniref:alpha/beta fold hydrolase n=1 Tax=Haloferula sp. TaxID=2497595 RepID=UPI00329D8280
MSVTESRVEMPPGMAMSTSATGPDLARLLMRPKGPPRGGVMIVHGLGEHIARYIPLASMLVEGGCVVTGVDFPGHARSPGGRGDLGSWEMVESIFDESVSLLRKEAGEHAPMGMVAHSMGGLLGLRYLQVRPEVFSRAWLSSPLLRPTGKRPPWLRPLVRALASVVPGLVLSSGVRTSQCRVVTEGEAPDPHFHNRVTVGWGVEMWRIESRVWAELDRLAPELQLLMTQGEADEVCPPGHARELFGKLGLRDKELKMLEGELHEPLFGAQAVMVQELVKDWFESRGLIAFD